MKKISENLPWFINGTLGVRESQHVAAAIARDTQLRHEHQTWAKIESAVHDQPPAVVRPQLWVSLSKNLQENVSQNRIKRLGRVSWLYGGALGLVALFLLWFTVRPGVTLHWSVQGTALPEKFTIYRAVEGTNDYRIIREVTVQGEQDHYVFVDTSAVPFRAYVYQVRGEQHGGLIAVSQEINAGSFNVLPAQIVILFTSLMVGFFSATYVQVRWKSLLYHPGVVTI